MKNLSNAIAIPATYEDLLFLNKNKIYGAYILRKLYKKHMIIACIITVLVFSLSVSSPLIFKKDIQVQIPHKSGIINIDIILPPPNPTKDDKEISEMVSAIKTVKFTIPIVKPDALVNGEDTPPDISALEEAVPWTTTQAGTAGGVDITLLDNVVSTEENIVRTEEAPPPFTHAEVMPAYYGGEAELFAFFAREIQYPEIARRAGIQGKVYLSIIVEKDGSVTNAAIEKGIGGGCEEEALRVAKQLSKFHPGMQNGNPVRVKMTIPIMFKLND